MNLERKAGSFEPTVPNIFSDGYSNVGNGATPLVSNKGSSWNGNSMASLSVYRQPRRRSTIPLAWSSQAQGPMSDTSLQSKLSSKIYRRTFCNTRRLMVAPRHEESSWAGKTDISNSELLCSRVHCGDLHRVSSVDSMLSLRAQAFSDMSNLDMFLETPKSPSLFPFTECRVQSFDGLMKQKSPPADSKNASNPSKRPARDNRAPQKKSRATRTSEKTAEADEDCGRDEESNDVNKCVESFACPFYRRHPERYFDCISLKMPRISDVKQHLKRRHMANYFCPKCLKGFSALKPFQEHVVQQDCSMDLSENTDDVSPTTHNAIKVRFERGLSPRGQWDKIWKILFGDIDNGQNPYHEGVFKEITGIIRGIWAEEGQHIISNVQKTKDMPEDCADQLRPVVLELLARVETRFEQKALEGNSKERSNNAESTLEKLKVDTKLGLTHGPSLGIQTNIAPHDTTLSSSNSGVACALSEGLGSVKRMCGLSMPLGSQDQQAEMPYLNFTTRDLPSSSDGDNWLNIEPHGDILKNLFETVYLEGAEDWINVVDPTQDDEILRIED
ncbi:uncharacterized protein FMAN_05334 [Fusarium mangiferae]|uniref:C2H2-type domain-containing protein n=1 Tax=Fusarium mangiferae TaxID=192010 RepID=A0A1L7SX04_FUSMA|nr:uncharacterized protein FMAN_05334 [Fusarium mangiferae]CVK87825.1 uncharacterized protein FMAN_05334 [Fusarium mangiferae]